MKQRHEKDKPTVRKQTTINTMYAKYCIKINIPPHPSSTLTSFPPSPPTAPPPLTIWYTLRFASEKMRCVGSVNTQNAPLPSDARSASKYRRKVQQSYRRRYSASLRRVFRSATNWQKEGGGANEKRWKWRWAESDKRWQKIREAEMKGGKSGM